MSVPEVQNISVPKVEMFRAYTTTKGTAAQRRDCTDSGVVSVAGGVLKLRQQVTFHYGQRPSDIFFEANGTAYIIDRATVDKIVSVALAEGLCIRSGAVFASELNTSGFRLSLDQGFRRLDAHM